jgi:hypothetical protein
MRREHICQSKCAPALRENGKLPYEKKPLLFFGFFARLKGSFSKKTPLAFLKVFEGF